MQVDVSTYPKAAPVSQPTMLDTVGKIQGLEQQSLAISKAQLDQVNQGYSYLMRELNSLPPDAGPDQMREFATNAVKMRLIPNDMAAQFISTIPNDPAKIPEFKKVLAAKLLNTNEAIQHWYGQQTTVNDNQTITPAAQSPFFGLRPTGAPIQIQNPPGQNVTSNADANYGQPNLLGAQPPQIPPGTQPQPGGFGSQYQVPSAPTPRFQATPPVAGAPTPSPTVIAPPTPPMQTGPSTGLPTGVPESIRAESTQLAADREIATKRLQGIAPLRAAMPLINQTTTGIGAPQYQTIKAALYQAGILNANQMSDTVAYQELEKLLKQYIQRSGYADRSDAQQALASTGNPNTGQLNPALLKTVRDAVAFDRIEAARAVSWRGPESGRGYGQHRTTFPTNVDHRAFSFDFLPQEDRTKLLTEMKEKLGSSNANTRATAQKFWDSLAIASPNTPTNPRGLGIIQPPD